MNKQFLLSVVVVFLVTMVTDFLVHGLLLQADYASQAALMRTEADAMRHMPAMMLGQLLLAIGVTAIYRRGREAGKPWLGQGVRFGCWFALAACVPGFLIYYAVQPTGLMVVVKQIIFGGIATVVICIAAAAMNKSA